MTITKSDIGYVATILDYLSDFGLDTDSELKLDAKKFSKKFELLACAMCNDDSIVVDTDLPFPVASYEHG